MKPIYFVLAGMFCYAIANVMLEQKLARYNNLTLIICWCSVILLMSVALRPFTDNGESIYSIPWGWDLVFMLIVSIAFFGGDYFYTKAYTIGGNLYTIVCAGMIFPVFASVMKLAWTGVFPNYWQMGGYALAAGAILSIAKGNGTF